jgi:hypothetical protein
VRWVMFRAPFTTLIAGRRGMGQINGPLPFMFE